MRKFPAFAAILGLVVTLGAGFAGPVDAVNLRGAVDLRPADAGVRHKTVSANQPAPLVAIVIDDLGADVPHTREALALPPAISLSFLPYPKESAALSHEAHMAGHQILVHMPMEPDGNDDPGPLALREDQLPSENLYRLHWMLSRVADYEGANNHMGSKFTASRAALAPVMRELAGKLQFFLDSRTTAKSQAEDVARSFGLLTGRRDVFLDDDQHGEAVEKQLTAMENFARSHGSVIAIGHPHAETLAALRAWTALAEKRGFHLLPVSAVLRARAGNPNEGSLAAPRG